MTKCYDKKGDGSVPSSDVAIVFFFFVTLGLDLCDTKVYEP